MIKEIITYPTPPSVHFAAPVRKISEVIELVKDLKDTINANSLDALAAFQIGSPYNIVVIKQDDDSFLELYNPMLVRTEGEQRTEETTAYFPGLSAMVNRADKISVVYEDSDLKSHSLQAEGAYSILLQRKIDYTFGSSFINKLDPDEKKLFQAKLEFGSNAAQIETCPTVFKREYITKLINIFMIAMVVLLGVSFFVEQETSADMWTYQVYLALSVVFFNIVYFFYAQYEGSQYSSCSSCQIGNIIGTVIISLLKTSVIVVLSYFLI